MASEPPLVTRKQSIAAVFVLLLTAFIWGMCFVAQRSSMEHIGPFLFNGIRVMLGALTLIVVLAIMRLLKGAKSRGGHLRTVEPGDDTVSSQVKTQYRPLAPLLSFLTNVRDDPKKRAIVLGGIICGFVLFVGSNLQQIAMVTTPASKAAFITTLYIVLVPLIGIAFRQRTRWNTWVSVLIAVGGLYLLCISESFEIASGDVLLLICAIFWALHILFVGRFVPGLTQAEVLRLCIVQFLTTGILSLLCAPLFDSFFVSVPLTLSVVIEVLPELSYAGILSSGVAFTLQAIGQKYAPPAPAAVIMSTESVFGLLGGMVLLHEILVGREILGCILMFAAVILAQLTFRKKRN